MTEILRRLVPPELLQDREFTYQRAHLKTRGEVDQYREIQGGIKKTYIYFRDPLTHDWRFGEEPHHVRGLLAVMAVGTAVLYAATLVLRAIQTTIILAGVFFRAYKSSYEHRKKVDFSETFFNTIELKIYEQKEGLLFIGRSVFLDTKCATAMGVSAVSANFYGDMKKVLQMEIIFSEMEKEWNKGPDFDIESGVEDDWHADNSAVANGALFLKNHSLKDMTFSSLLGELSKARELSNRSFYIFQCAQPLSGRFRERMEWIEGEFPSYAALVQHHEEIARRIRGERF
ncbi:MAG: hypothetical protein KFB93_05475 [Simkaniaceae bacterium]|nr:MAG: hypothetical protein KFB93_05475 [Simkaniaceae bacterium]